MFARATSNDSPSNIARNQSKIRHIIIAELTGDTLANPTIFERIEPIKNNVEIVKQAL